MLKCEINDLENKNRAKAFLRKVRELDHEVDAAMKQVDSYEASATRITSHYDHMASKVNGNSSENKIINLIDAREKCNRAIDCFVDYRDKCLNLIDRIPNPDLKKVLMFRYIDYLKWNEIKKKMQYSESQTFKLHSQALSEFEKVLNTYSKYDSK